MAVGFIFCRTNSKRTTGLTFLARKASPNVAYVGEHTYSTGSFRQLYDYLYSNLMTALFVSAIPVPIISMKYSQYVLCWLLFYI